MGLEKWCWPGRNAGSQLGWKARGSVPARAASVSWAPRPRPIGPIACSHSQGEKCFHYICNLRLSSSFSSVMTLLLPFILLLVHLRPSLIQNSRQMRESLYWWKSYKRHYLQDKIQMLMRYLSAWLMPTLSHCSGFIIILWLLYHNNLRSLIGSLAHSCHTWLTPKYIWFPQCSTQSAHSDYATAYEALTVQYMLMYVN